MNNLENLLKLKDSAAKGDNAAFKVFEEMMFKTSEKVMMDAAGLVCDIEEILEEHYSKDVSPIDTLIGYGQAFYLSFCENSKLGEKDIMYKTMDILKYVKSLGVEPSDSVGLLIKAGIDLLISLEADLKITDDMKDLDIKEYSEKKEKAIINKIKNNKRDFEF